MSFVTVPVRTAAAGNLADLAPFLYAEYRPEWAPGASPESVTGPTTRAVFPGTVGVVDRVTLLGEFGALRWTATYIVTVPPDSAETVGWGIPTPKPGGPSCVPVRNVARTPGVLVNVVTLPPASLALNRGTG